ncbi:MAG: hypothetical protein ACW98Y_09870 [Candidatus Thorarchaeota archaeon]
MSSRTPNGIGTLAERSLHSMLKDRLTEPGDRQEVKVDGYVIDIVRDDLLIEIQTRNFGTMKTKLMALLPNHRIRLVHPIPTVRWVVRESLDGEVISRRKSPKKMDVLNLFEELVSIPTLINHSNFEIEVLEVFEEQVMQNDGKGSWRRKGWSNVDRRLIEVVGSHLFREANDFIKLLPPDLETPFTNTELAKSLGRKLRVAQKITYCLRKMGALKTKGKRGNAHLHVF